MKTKIKVTKTQKRLFNKVLQNMTSNRIASMTVIDKEKSIKLLFDKPSGNYVIFNNYDLSSYYSDNYYTAVNFFNKRIALLSS